MERNRISNITEALKSRPARVVGSLIVAGSAVAGIPQAEGKELSVPQSIPQEDFRPVTIPSDEEIRVQEHIIVIPSPTLSPEPTPTEKSLSAKEKKIQKIKDEAKKIYNFAKESGDINAKLLDQLHDNLPLYLAAADKYDLDWVVLWVTHRRESGASDVNSMAFDPSHRNSDVQGSWQISTSWDNEFRTEAFSGLEFTLKFQQRHEGDAEDTATAARMLKRNIAKQMENGKSYKEALSHAIYLYCYSEGETDKRMGMISELDDFFGELAGVQFSK